jgi:hypothetical protein
MSENESVVPTNMKEVALNAVRQAFVNELLARPAG